MFNEKSMRKSDRFCLDCSEESLYLDSDLALANNTSNLVAEPSSSYNLKPSGSSTRWVAVLIDFPGVQGLYTYSLPDELLAEPGDIVSVPFGMQ
ncbi:MAG: hypothetical protein QNJ60_21650, partial [Xenococcaceae cyanobacterium MO_188.B19]|nr:hypothetical protein [Xenococcaceae cyanobacterium MO_188.B19]